MLTPDKYKIKVVFFDDAAKRAVNDPDDDDIRDYTPDGEHSEQAKDIAAGERILQEMRERKQ